MLKRSTALSVVLLWTVAGLALPAHAGAPGSAAIEAAPEAGDAIEHIEIVVEGEPLPVRARGFGTDAFEIDATPIFARLNSRHEARGTILGYWRFQDGAVIGLDFADGKVRANGAVLGALPGFRTRETADTWLSPNAISVLTGTQAAQNAAGTWTFDLDKRLKPQFDLDLWVEGEAVNVGGGLEPRTIGPVLLVPLRPVAEALGHTLAEDRAKGIVTVTRSHDSAVIALEIATGLVTVNGVPSGISPNMTYADAGALILPFSAVETLTGAHIKLTPGTNRVDVRLDSRLASLALPGERVDDAAARTPFTPERLDFQLSDRGPVKLDFFSRIRSYNTVTTIETVGGVEPPSLLTPRWMSVDIQSLDGWRATAGDYNGTFRELAGTDVARVRGLSYRARLSSGTLLAIAAGVPLTGARAEDNGASTPEFGGFAAGVRIMPVTGQIEYGASAAVSEDGRATRAVISVQKEFSFAGDAKKPGFETAFLAADAGVFNADTGTAFDLRGRGELRYRLAETLAAQAALTYDGAAFQAPATSGAPDAAAGDRATGALTLGWHARRPIGFLHHLAGGLRAGITYTGGPDGGRQRNAGAALNGRLGQRGPDVSFDIGEDHGEAAGQTSRARALAARLFQAFEWGAVTAAFSRTIDTEGITNDRFVSNLQFKGWRRSLSNGASFVAAPSASVLWTPETAEIRAGAAISADSGAALGERLRLTGQVNALASADPEKDKSAYFGNLSATYRLFNNISLQTVLATDFTGRTDLSLALRGSIRFNDARKHTAPEDGTGILKGRVFHDRNRDGIHQAGEPGIPGVRVAIAGTRLSLLTDNQGNYTIQNLKTGLHELGLDRRSLPLGMLVGITDGARATVGDGRLTTLDLPVVSSGQLRGALFEDANGNGRLDRGERRLEGEWLELRRADGSEPVQLQAAAFGQYGFERLAPGRYTLVARGARRPVQIEIELTEDALFQEVDVPVPAGASAPGAVAGLLGAP